MLPPEVKVEPVKVALPKLIKEYEKERLFVLVDENTQQFCYPLIKSILPVSTVLITISEGENNKSIETVAHIWKCLTNSGASRKSLLINLGGGLLCDVGGFAAATFKRGIDFINIPTTLLAMVDASVGGKTGINFEGLKNEIGVFQQAKWVIVDITFLRTLRAIEIKSGFAEMLKHALISDEMHFHELSMFNANLPDLSEQSAMNVWVKKSIGIKYKFVKDDLKEAKQRKALNFGHTIGHAFESFMIQKNDPITHGNAVAQGIICELFLSRKKGFPEKKQKMIIEFIIKYFGLVQINEEDYSALLEYISHDKKNYNNLLNFTLLRDIAVLQTDVAVKNEEIVEALEFYRKLLD